MDVETSYDHLAVSGMDDPYGLLAEARQRCPVAHSDQYGGFWTLFRYEDVGQAARNPALFSSAQGDTVPPHGFPLAIPPIEVDPPNHIKYRGPLLERFAPGAVAKLEPDMRRCVTRLIDGFIERGTVEFTTELTGPLPAEVITGILNIPEDDQDRFRDWTVRQMTAGDLSAVLEEFQYFAGVYAERTANPRDPDEDLPSMLLRIEIDGQPLPEIEFLAMMSELLGAGLDTTAHSAAHVLLLLSRRPELKASLIDDPALIPAAIEEMLRYLTPLPILARTTTGATSIGGIDIPAGAKVQLNWIAANHDPDEFAEPEEVRFDRSPNRHLAFGAGPHRCIGANLARLELRVLLEEVLARLPDYAVDESGVVRYPGVTRGIKALPATFAPGIRLGS